MNVPKILAATAIENHTLLIQFDNNERKKYNIAPLLSKEMFAPLSNVALFKSVRVERGGYAVFWNNDIDISEYELWIHGEKMS
jgi:hypothetical protein